MTRPLSMIAALAIRYLERRGRLVLDDSFLRDQDAFATAGPFTILRSDGPFKVVPARCRVVQPGETIVSSSATGMPAPGIYTPKVEGYSARTVKQCVGAYVFYDAGRSVRLPSWERWVRRAKAVCS